MNESTILARMPQLYQNKKIWLSILLGFLLVITLTLYINSDSPVALLVDGKVLAAVKGEDVVSEAIDKVKKDLEKTSGSAILGYGNTITFSKENVDKTKTVSDEALLALLKDNLSWQTESWKIKISGKPDLSLQSEKDANEALEKIKAYYIPSEGNNRTVESVAFAEDVKIVKETAVLGTVLTPDSAVEAMVKGLNKIVQHEVVQGDTLWYIAQDNKMTVDELKAINPELKSDFLKLGQKLNLVKVEPLLTVVATVTTTVAEKISYKTTYESDASLWRGQQRVKTAGEYGEREVTYRITTENDHETVREVLQENILTEPVTQVVVQGTKRMIASRGDGGSGKLGWPMRGRITCPFGKYRGSWGIHQGIDIDGLVGDPIYAAEGGVVIQAGYQGLYGRLVTIDHGDGLSTLYAHMDQIKVAIGQKLERGDLVGTVGLTGRTTGSHLHFEVQINGTAKNPMNYLN